MHGRWILAASLFALAGCEALPAAESLQFGCTVEGDCLAGQDCVLGRCVIPGADPGQVGGDDAGRVDDDDGGTLDGDGGALDGDAGGARDGGPVGDAGGARDGGASDAGSASDAGGVNDAGAPDDDAGAPDDDAGALEPDAGAADDDAGFAAPDAGFDPCVDDDADLYGPGCPAGDDCQPGDGTRFVEVTAYDDTDGDGVFEAAPVLLCSDGAVPAPYAATPGTDNCPTANADQHDEDGDDVGDVCDVCPADFDAAQADGDGDDVGDVCDPRPTLFGDSIVLFDPFTGSALGAGWSIVAGTWTVQNDELVQASTANGRMIVRTDVALAGVAAESGFVITALGSSPTNAGPLVRVSGSSGYLADFLYATGNYGLHLHEVTSNAAGSPFTSMATTAPALNGDFLRVRGGAVGTTIGADLRGVGAISASDGTYSTGSVGLRTNRMAAKFRYFIVYSIGS